MPKIKLFKFKKKRKTPLDKYLKHKPKDRQELIKKIQSEIENGHYNILKVSQQD